MTTQQLKPIDHGQDVAMRPQAVTPMEMLNQAVADGRDIDILERLMTLQERYQAAEAQRAFLDAKAAFKAEAPAIVKDKNNLQYNSKYSSIGAIVNTMNPILSKYGLDASWDIWQSEDLSEVKVTCTLSHRDGHSTSVPMRSKPDGTGQKNPIQQMKSAVTYLKIATYEAVVGVASDEGNADDDGNAAGAAPISEEQTKRILDLIDETESSAAQFCKYFKIAAVAALPASKFDAAIKALEKKRGQQ
jgi:hypothetical protein